MLRTSNKKEVKRLSTGKSLLIIIILIALYILATWIFGADYSDSLNRISY